MRKKLTKSIKKLGPGGFIKRKVHRYNVKIEPWEPSKKSGGRIAA